MKQLGEKFLPFALGAAVIYSLFIGGYRYQKAVSAAAPACQTPVYVVDPGHGGEDGGAVSVSGKTESGVNLEIARRLDALLVFWGQKTCMTRDGDYAIYDSAAGTILEKKVSDLKNRAAMVNRMENPILLSIHQNQFSQGKYHGAQVFYGRHPDSQALAQAVQEQLRSALDPGNHRKIKPAEKVYLMDAVECPAILIECGFLSNREEEQKLLSSGYQTKVSMAICGAVLSCQ